jgi:hypothetical protein
MKEKKPVRGFTEEGGRSQLGVQPQGERKPVTHEAMSERDASLEASIRMKLGRGEELDAEERRFFARMPADDQEFVQ